jgi:hypothetical protein
MFKTIVTTAALLSAVEGRHVNDVEAGVNMDSFFRTHGKQVKAEDAASSSKVKREMNGRPWWRVNSEDKIDPMVQRNGGSKCIATEIHFYNIGNCVNCEGRAGPTNYETKQGPPPTAEEIQAKLKEAGYAKPVKTVESTSEGKKKFKLSDLPKRSRDIDVARAERKERVESRGVTDESVKEKRDLNYGGNEGYFRDGHNANTLGFPEVFLGWSVVGGVPSDYVGIFNNRCHPHFDNDGNVRAWWMTRVHWHQEEDYYTWRYLVFDNNNGEYSCESAAFYEHFEIPIWNIQFPMNGLGTPMGVHSMKVTQGYVPDRGLFTVNCVEKEEMKGIYVLYQGKENDCTPGYNGYNQLYHTAIGYIPPETQYDRLEEYDSDHEFIDQSSYTYHNHWNKDDSNGAPFKNQHPMGEVLFTAGGRYNDYRHNSFEYNCPLSSSDIGGSAVPIPGADANYDAPHWVGNAQTYYPEGGTVFRLTRTFTENCNDLLPNSMEDVTTNRNWNYGASEVAGVFCYTNDAKLKHFYTKVCVNHYADFIMNTRYHNEDRNYHRNGWGWWVKNYY